jgi:flap endonuclease-1
MGIKNLNRFLLDNCSKKSIKKIHLKQLAQKTLTIDISIYLYKFVGENTLLESMYLFISILKKYEITPIFIFDGKPPPEKKELLIKRRIEKLEAEQKYNDLQKQMEGLTEEKMLEMENLRKQFIRITEEDITKVKQLLEAYNVSYYNSPYEADQLCAYLVKERIAWGCITDDMDMFLYGCTNVIRHISLLNHTAVIYDFEMILRDLKMSEDNFREIMVLSGTDYNIKMETSLYNTMKRYNEYNKYVFQNKDLSVGFYDWLSEYTDYLKNKDSLIKTYNMFLLTNYDFSELNIETKEMGIEMEKLKSIMQTEGFIFI